MKEGSSLIFSKVFFLIVVVTLLEVGFFFYKYVPNKSFTGFSIQEDIMGSYSKISDTSKLFLITQWAVLILFLMFAYVRDGRVLNEDRKKVELDLNEISNRLRASDTNLDALYAVLKKRRTLRLSTIAKAFKIKNELAKEWVKTLESGDLVTIEKAGGDIIVRLNEEKETDQF
jgi:hypothetical protein